MKKVLSLILTFVFVIGLCAAVPVTANAASVDDLKFELNEDGKSYSVSAKNTNIKGELVIPNTYNGLPVTTVAEEGFMFCSSLTSIIIPDSIEVIEDYGFYSCSSVDSLELPKNLKKIGRSAFYSWHKLPSVTIPASVEFINGGIFHSSYELTEIKVESGNKNYKSVDGILYNIDMTELLDYPVAKGGSTFTVPQTVRKIAGWCFSNNRYLTSIELNDNIKTIEDGTFAYCRTLKILDFGNNVTRIGVNSFRDCDKIVSINFPDSIEIIDSFAFFDCGGLTSVEIPAKVTVIKDFSFASCVSLETVTIPSGVVSIEEAVFANNSNLKTVKFKGTEAQWKLITIEPENNDNLLNVNMEFLPESESHVHNFISEITEYPTCTIAGVKTFTCSCGSRYTETIEALGHKWNDGSITMHPTCTTSGEKTFVCKVCYTSKSELIPANGHKETVVGKKDATENEVGYTGDKVCSVCNKEIEKGEEIPKLSTTLATPVATVKNSATGVKVTWKAIDGATSYKVYRKTYSTKTKKYGSWKTCGTVKSTSYVDTNAKSGTKYIYTVKAFNGDTKSGIKNSSSILFLAQPTVKIANASTGVKVKWNKITGATGYKVYRAEYVNGKWTGWKSVKTIDKGSTVSWTDKSAKSGVKYKYTVKAVNGKTGSTYKSSSSLLYLAQPKTTVKAVSDGVKVSWTQITGATSYKIYRSEYNTKTKKWSSWKSIKTAKSTSKSYTDKTAKKGVKYRYTVKAVKGKTASTYKASGSVKR